mmetsp:Transcript_173148/g.555287  ORF Transcript_173148/g.555287 Transcript_173148/m.555287 type:complete len:314 (-) Transcript_173148:63-1004(-)
MGSGSGMANPMSLGMMMGMMASPMGMPTMGMPPMMGMQQMGMPPMGFPGMPAGDRGGKSKRRKKSASSDGSDAASSQAEESAEEEPSPEPERRRRAAKEEKPGSRRKDREKEREPVRIEEVERFLDDNRINEEAAQKVRALSPASQRQLIERPLTGDVQNPSKVIIARVRSMKSQVEQTKSNSHWGAWQNMMGASPESVDKYIKDNDLDDSAKRQLRSLAPHQQAVALQWDLSKYRNPSAKFMSMANDLGTANMPRFPMMQGMPGMPGMPMMQGMPTMPGMPQMMPGMGMSPMHGMHPGMRHGMMPGMPMSRR